MAPLRVLITNDDGYQARGIRALGKALAATGHDVLAVAPLDDQSGVGSARAGMVQRPIRTAEDAADGVTYIGVDGTPALAVTLAQVGAFGTPPDVVVSGVNHGHNIGVPILHSGTVAAALTAAAQGLSAIAVSCDSEDPKHLDTAAAIATRALDWLASEPAGTVLTMNVPDRPLEELEGVRRARLAPIERSRIAGAQAPNGEPMITLTSPSVAPDPDTDEALLAAGYVTVTPIVGIREAPGDGGATYLAEHLS
ncbi:5'/3'-nucleotidase SurE [Kribbella sp. CA-253562]|uniref:5'/3'-nucleotidase SurE n=1 Tax=Kribbella sp. CA-253562 TaxID=3239942 RepID=UPI003D8F12E7